MDNLINETLWNQFGASIDMLERAIAMCPDEFWDTEDEFWYSAYHCLFYLDYYLTLDPAGYVSPAPFSNSEAEDRRPERTYTKAELLAYLQASRMKCHDLIAGLTEERMRMRWVNPWKDYSLFEMLLYNMRHVQHHTAQLNRLLRLRIDKAPGWVGRTDVPLSRKGAKSFGKRLRPDLSGGNFKALFEAIEREQELRGNL